MVQMIDTEGADLTLDDFGKPLFDIDLWADGLMTLNVPMIFDTDNGEYDSDGVLQVNLRDILQEYLREAYTRDAGHGLIPLARLLREFADVYERLRLKQSKRRAPA